jgi:hypothetical protein
MLFHVIAEQDVGRWQRSGTAKIIKNPARRIFHADTLD